MPAASEQDGRTGAWPQQEAISALELAEPIDLRPLDWQAPPQPSPAPTKPADQLTPAALPPAQLSLAANFPPEQQQKASGHRASSGLRQGFLSNKSAKPQRSTTRRTGTQSLVDDLVSTARSQVGPLEGTAPRSVAPSAAVLASAQPSAQNIDQPSAPASGRDQPGDDSDTEAEGSTSAADRATNHTAVQPATEEEKRAAFAMVQPHCAAIMRSKDDAAGLAQHLLALQRVLPRAPAAGLQACLDYILLPLVHLMDSVAATGSASGRHAAGGRCAFPAAQTQKAAEAAVSCSALLLGNCSPVDATTAAELLPRFAAVAELSRSQASEEVRSGALKCLNALLRVPHLGSASTMEGGSSGATSTQDAMLSEGNAPFLAYLASLLLKASEDECTAGSGGSSALRGLALQGLASLIVRVGPGDAWGFALPGITGRLGKALVAAAPGAGRQVPKGPAGSSQAAALSLQALCSVLVCTLGTSSFPGNIIPADKDESAGGLGKSQGSAEGALQALRQLEARSRQGDVPKEQSSTGGNEAPRINPLSMSQQPGKMRIERSAAWLKGAAPRLSLLLQRVLPPMCLHPRPSVRAELAKGVVRLLQQCSQSLPDSRELLLEMACTLAQDEWPAVSLPSRQWLKPPADSGLTHADTLTAESALKLARRLLGDLSKALHQGEDQGTLHSRRLTTALQAASPTEAADALLKSPVQAGMLCATLFKCFAFDPKLAPLLLAASGGDAGPAAAAVQAPPPGHRTDLQAGVAGSILPRLPMGLALVTAPPTYDALAAVARTLGRIAALAGGTALHSLIDALSRSLQQVAQSMKQSTKPRAATAEAAADCWGSSSNSEACRAATAVTVLSELVYGASSAWQSAMPVVPAKRSAELAPLVQMLQEQYVQDALWGVSTSPPEDSPSSDDANSTDAAPTPQALGENVLLAKALLEGVGTCARAMGRRYGQSGRLLRPVVLPVLERLGDRCPAVAAAAHTSLGSICCHCNYAGLQGLVAANTDYIVDGLCTQLRTLHAHPRAPALFAALLGRSGVPTTLLPLLAEPARAAVRGLAISSRHRHPQHTAAFLRVLIQVNAGTHAEARAVLQLTHQLAAEVQAAAERLPDKSSAEEANCQGARVASPTHASSTVIQEMDPAGDQASPGTESAAATESDTSKRMSEVKDYFRERWEAKDEAQHQQGTDDSAEGGTVAWSDEQWQHADLLRGRAHAAATLAHAAGDVSGPLVTFSNTQVALLAMEVAVASLQTLRATSEAREVREEAIEPLVSNRGGMAGVQPLPPDTPQLLPMVHLVWGPLMAAVKDWRLPVVERALRCLAELAEAGGGSFLARRMSSEAWPALTQLLRYGPRPWPADPASTAFSGARQTLAAGDEQQNDHATDKSQSTAPAALDRARTSVALAITSMAGSDRAGSAWTSLAFAASEELCKHIGSTRSPGLREASCQAVLALAALDCDAVWLALTRHAVHDSAFSPPSAPRHAAAAASDLRAGQAAARPASFPSFRHLCPVQSSQHALTASKPLPGVVAQAAKLLVKVEALQPAWHAGLSLACM